MRFVETPIFTKVITGLLDDDEYRSLQIALMLRPEQGPVIRGAGGLRKVRWAKVGPHVFLRTRRTSRGT